jgi:hypothetical protein
MFLGEEKIDSGAKEDLAAKLREIDPVFFGDIQFMMCYAVDGTKIKFYAFDGSHEAQKQHCPFIPLTPELDITIFLDRFIILRTVINIARIMVTITDLVPTPAYPLMKRRKIGDSNISWNPKDVKKEVLITDLPYAGEDAEARFEFLKKMYEHARGQRGLVQIKSGPSLRRRRYQVTLSTRGIDTRAKSKGELQKMAKDLVSGLAWLHRAGYLHRDIRSPNILYDPVAKQYVLIDFEHGAKVGNGEEVQIYGDNIPLAAWDDDTLDDGLYTVMSEMYQLGKLLDEKFGYMISDQAEDFVKKLKGKKMTAEEALEHEWICTLL